MSTTHPKNPAKPQALPRAEALFAICHDGDLCDYLGEFDIRETAREAFDHIRTDEAVFPVAVLPCASAKQAKAVAAFWNMGEEERVQFVADQLFHPLADYWRAKNPDAVKRDQARAVLSALFTAPAKGERGAG